MPSHSEAKSKRAKLADEPGLKSGDLGDVLRSHCAYVVLVKLSWWANL